MLQGSGWTICDTQRISAAGDPPAFTYSQTDGLHIDRKYTHTIAEHQQIRDEASAAGKPMPGQLEMQLTQSFLYRVFYDALPTLFPESFNTENHIIPVSVVGNS